jgi:hypothetical protein
MTRATLRGVRLRSILLTSQRWDGSNRVLPPGRASAAGLIAAHPVLPKNAEEPGEGDRAQLLRDVIYAWHLLGSPLIYEMRSGVL